MDIILGIFVIIAYFILFVACFSLLSYLLDLVGCKSVNAPKKKRNSHRRLYSAHQVGVMRDFDDPYWQDQSFFRNYDNLN